MAGSSFSFICNLFPHKSCKNAAVIRIVHELCVFSVSINPMELQDQRAPCNNS
ncbi:hypothetical protein EE612_005013 [Oryza sativa]|nr:hypothetical protein EE612_005013 [Oryza sativa]